MIVGKSSDDKIKELRKTMEEKKWKGVVVSMLDEIAWLFNLRGTDIQYNPGELPFSSYIFIIFLFWLYLSRLVFFAYALITLKEAILFIDPSQVSDIVSAHLGDEIIVKPYEAFFTELHDFAKIVVGKETIVIAKQASLAIANAIGEVCLGLISLIMVQTMKPSG